MKTYAQLLDFATKLALNASGTNQSLLSSLLDEQHRLLIEKYFDNERTVTMSTIGSNTITTTAALAAGATSATLTTAWTYGTGYQYITFSDGEMRSVMLTNGSTAISWSVGLQNACTTTLTAVGVQDYNIPSDVSKITNGTITIGQMKFVTAPVQTRNEWDRINFLPYNNDIPAYFYIYNGRLEFFPVPSTTGNIITINYKGRVPDFSWAWQAGTPPTEWAAGTAPIDYTYGTLASGGVTAGSTAVTGTGTSWDTAFPTGTDISYLNLNFRVDPNSGGDGIWYPIQSFTDATHLVLKNPIVNAATITTSTKYTIGQLPILQEDFHPLIAYEALRIYHASIVPDQGRYEMYTKECEKREKLLEDYAGTKQVNVDLGDSPRINNPNLFVYGTSST